MYIRRALAADYPHLATVADNDDPMDAYLFPGRQAHPSAYHHLVLKRLKYSAKEPQGFVIVAEETEASDVFWNGVPGIVGYCFWRREGASKTTRSK